MGYGDKEGYINEIPLTPRTKRILELSYQEARELNHNYISPEHILLALIRDGEGVAYTILVNVDIDFNKLNKLINENMASQDKNVKVGKVENKLEPTPNLDQFGRDLTVMASEGKLDPVIGRDKETERVLEILLRRTKNNPCLIGEPGVGKTAIAEGLAQKCYLAMGRRHHWILFCICQAMRIFWYHYRQQLWRMGYRRYCR